MKAGGGRGRRRSEAEAMAPSAVNAVPQPPRPSGSLYLMDLNPANSAVMASEERQRSKGRGSTLSNEITQEKELGLLKPTRKTRVPSSNPYRGLPSGAHIKRRPPSLPRRRGAGRAGGTPVNTAIQEPEGQRGTTTMGAQPDVAASRSEGVTDHNNAPSIGSPSVGRSLRLDSTVLRGRREPSPAPTRPPRATKKRPAVGDVVAENFKRQASLGSNSSNASSRSNNTGTSSAFPRGAADSAGVALQGAVDALEQSRRYRTPVNRSGKVTKPVSLTALPSRHSSEEKKDVLESYLRLCDEMGEPPREDWIQALCLGTHRVLSDEADDRPQDEESSNAAQVGKSKSGNNTRRSRSAGGAKKRTSSKRASARSGTANSKRSAAVHITDSPPPGVQLEGTAETKASLPLFPASAMKSTLKGHASSAPVAVSSSDRSVDEVIAYTQKLAKYRAKMDETESLRVQVRNAEERFVDYVRNMKNDTLPEAKTVGKSSRRNSLKVSHQSKDLEVEFLKERAQKLTEGLAEIQSAVAALLLSYDEQRRHLSLAAPGPAKGHGDVNVGSEHVTPLLSPAQKSLTGSVGFGRRASGTIISTPDEPPSIPIKYREFLESQERELVQSLEKMRDNVTRALDECDLVHCSRAEKEPLFPTPLLVLSAQYPTTEDETRSPPADAKMGDAPRGGGSRLSSDERGSTPRSSLSQLSQRVKDTLLNREAYPSRERRGSAVLTTPGTSGRSQTHHTGSSSSAAAPVAGLKRGSVGALSLPGTGTSTANTRASVRTKGNESSYNAAHASTLAIQGPPSSGGGSGGAATLSPLTASTQFSVGFAPYHYDANDTTDPCQTPKKQETVFSSLKELDNPNAATAGGDSFRGKTVGPVIILRPAPPPSTTALHGAVVNADGAQSVDDAPASLSAARNQPLSAKTGKPKRSRSGSVGTGRKTKTGAVASAGRRTVKPKPKERGSEKLQAGEEEEEEDVSLPPAAPIKSPQHAVAKTVLEEAKTVWNSLLERNEALQKKGSQSSLSPRPSTAEAAASAKCCQAAPDSAKRRAESATATLGEDGQLEAGDGLQATLDLSTTQKAVNSGPHRERGGIESSPPDMFQLRIAQMDSQQAGDAASNAEDELLECTEGKSADGESGMLHSRSAFCAEEGSTDRVLARSGDPLLFSGSSNAVPLCSALNDPGLLPEQRADLAASMIVCTWRAYKARRRSTQKAMQINSLRAKTQLSIYKQTMLAKVRRFLWTVVCRLRLRRAALNRQAKKSSGVRTLIEEKRGDGVVNYAHTSRDRFEQSREQRKQQKRSEAAAETARITPGVSHVSPKRSPPIVTTKSLDDASKGGTSEEEEEAAVPPLPLLKHNISTKSISSYGKDSEGFEVAVLHRLLQAPLPLLYVFSVCISKFPSRPPMGYAKLKEEGSPEGDLYRVKCTSASPPMDQQEACEPLPCRSSSGKAAMVNDGLSGQTTSWNASADGLYHVPFCLLKRRLPCYSQVGVPATVREVGEEQHNSRSPWRHPHEGAQLSPDQFKRKSSWLLKSGSTPVGRGASRLLPYPPSAYYSSVADTYELRHEYPVVKSFSRPFERWGNAHKFSKKVFTAAAIYAWKLIFSHTPHDDFKQRQLVTSEEKRSRLERVQQRNKMILACYVVRSEREWLREVSKDLSFAGQIYNPKRALDPNDPNFEKNCRDTFEFVEDFLFQCFPTINSLEEIPSFLLGSGVYFTLKESFHYFYSPLSNDFSNANGGGAPGGTADEHANSVGKRYPELLVGERVFLDNYEYTTRRGEALGKLGDADVPFRANLLEAARAFKSSSTAVDSDSGPYNVRNCSPSNLLKHFSSYQLDAIHRYELLVLLQHCIEHCSRKGNGAKADGRSTGTDGGGNAVLDAAAEAFSPDGGDANDTHTILNNTVSLASLAPVHSTPSASFTPTATDGGGGAHRPKHSISSALAASFGVSSTSMGDRAENGDNNHSQHSKGKSDHCLPPPLSQSTVAVMSEENRFPQILRLPKSAMNNSSTMQGNRPDGKATKFLKQREEELLYYLAAWERAGGERRDRLEKEYRQTEDPKNLRYFALDPDEECVLLFPKNYLIQLSEKLTYELLGMKLDLSVCEDLESIE